MSENRSWFLARIEGMSHAFRGLLIVWAEPHARIHTTATLAVITAGLFLRLGSSEWGLLVLAMSSVWTAEAFNTALEHLSDAAVSGRHPLVQAAKDAAAAGVLIAALFSIVIAGIVFVPHLYAGAE